MRAWWIRLLIRSGQPQLPQIQIVALLWSHFASSWDMYVSHRDWDSLQALAPLPFWCWLTESNRRSYFVISNKPAWTFLWQLAQRTIHFLTSSLSRFRDLPHRLEGSPSLLPALS